MADQATERRFTGNLLAMIGEISNALGISEEDQSCANGATEILLAIEKLKAAATPPADAALADAVAPGVMRCAKCKFGLQRVILSVRSGTASAGNSKTEPCPNGCGPLWPVTWKELAKEHLEVAERFFDESAVLRKDNETLRAELTALRAENARQRAWVDGVMAQDASAKVEPYFSIKWSGPMFGIGIPVGTELITRPAPFEDK